MSHPVTRQQIIKEIELIPEARLSELFKLLNSFRLESKHDYSSKVDVIMDFTGDWIDLDDQQDFETEIKNRRSKASTSRIKS